MLMKIKVYGADWCSDCISAKLFLKSRGIKFEYIVITDNDNQQITWILHQRNY